VPQHTVSLALGKKRATPTSFRLTQGTCLLGAGKDGDIVIDHPSGSQRVTMNCGAIAPELVASELFGHRRGAFTGATDNRKGAFESANGGTLFLDEIERMVDVTRSYADQKDALIDPFTQLPRAAHGAHERQPVGRGTPRRHGPLLALATAREIRARERLKGDVPAPAELAFAGRWNVFGPRAPDERAVRGGRAGLSRGCP
jgi:hypothetical protein